jgi:hypothetical protein
MLERLCYRKSMKTKKRSSDINVMAFQIMQEATRETSQPKPIEQPAKEKNPAAVALGRLGGLKGGPSRAKKLSSKRRKEIARKAAQTRWSK